VTRYFKDLEDKFNGMHSQFEDELMSIFQNYKKVSYDEDGKHSVFTAEVPFN
jgi:hypothetical protein